MKATSDAFLIIGQSCMEYNEKNNKLGSVAGPVIQANGRLTFEDDLTSGDLLYFTTQ